MAEWGVKETKWQKIIAFVTCPVSRSCRKVSLRVCVSRTAQADRRKFFDNLSEEAISSQHSAKANKSHWPNRAPGNAGLARPITAMTAITCDHGDSFPCSFPVSSVLPPC